MQDVVSRTPALRRGVHFAALVALGIMAACDSSFPTDLPRPGAPDRTASPAAALAPASDHAADVALSWLRLSFDLTREEVLSPPVAARAYAYVGIGLWEAVAPGVSDGSSLAGQLNGFDGVPTADEDLHWPTVANAAIGSLARRFYTSASSLRSIRSLERDFEDRFRDEVPGSVFGRSVAHGQRVAGAVWQWSRGDGYTEFADCPFLPGTEPGSWEPTGPDFEQAAQPCWGKLRPMLLRSADACAPASHPQYSEVPGSPFHREAMEVYQTVNDLTVEQRTIALYWADLAGETGTPAGHSLSITAQVLEQVGASLDVAAEAFARVGIGESDAFIGCWATKYHYNLLRPVTYINALIDPAWSPVLSTPPFPAYTSGHSNDAGASSTILAAMFGDDFAFTDHTNDALGFQPRSFDSFRDAALESAFSRLYGGIHYRADIVQGLIQGECVGRAVNRLAFRSGVLAASGSRADAAQ